jgi:electron transfer flavoprotein alpha subunit
MGNVLLVAEHLHGKFPKTTLVGVTAAKELAGKTGGKAIGLILGQGVDALANELAEYGLDVVAVDAAPLANYVADAYTSAIAEIVKQKGVEIVVGTATALGRTCCLAWRRGWMPASLRTSRTSSMPRPSSGRCGPAT